MEAGRRGFPTHLPATLPLGFPSSKRDDGMRKEEIPKIILGKGQENSALSTSGGGYHSCMLSIYLGHYKCLR